MVLKSNSLAMFCPGQSQSRQFSTRRSMVVFKHPTSANRTNCQIVLFRIIRLEATCTFVLLVSPGICASFGNSRVGITKLSSIVMLTEYPDLREWELRLPQDQDRSMILIGHTILAGRPGGQRHRSVRLCSVLLSNIDRDEDLAGTPLWPPEIEGVVSADRLRQLIALTELLEGCGLAIIGSIDAGNPLLILWQ